MTQSFNCWAVIVGISRYKNPSLNLQYADRDAEALYQLLLTPGGGQFKKEFICKLTNKRATTGNITQALRGFLKKPAREDVVFVYFACHGAPDPDRPSNVYLLTHDTDPQDIAGTALPMSDISRALKDTLHSEKVILLADTCHSAAIGGNIRSRGMNESTLVNRYLKDISASIGGIALLTSAEANEVSFEDEKWGGGHGVFTHFLLRGLQGEADTNRNGFVTVGELFEYVREQVKQATNHRQHPSIGSNPFDRNLPLAISSLVADDSSDLLNGGSLLLSPQQSNLFTRSRIVVTALSALLLIGTGGLVVREISVSGGGEGSTIDASEDLTIDSGVSRDVNERQRTLDEAFTTAQAFARSAEDHLSTSTSPDDSLQSESVEKAIADWDEAIEIMRDVASDDQLSQSSRARNQLQEYEEELQHTKVIEEALNIGQSASDLIQKPDISAEECEAVRQFWQMAIDYLQEIPPTVKYYSSVSKKIGEYKGNIPYAELKKVSADFRLAYYTVAPTAAAKSQTANSSDDWTEVAALWSRAIELMMKVPDDVEENQRIVKEKIPEYKRNKQIALKRASASKI